MAATAQNRGIPDPLAQSRTLLAATIHQESRRVQLDSFEAGQIAGQKFQARREIE